MRVTTETKKAAEDVASTVKEPSTNQPVTHEDTSQTLPTVSSAAETSHDEGSVTFATGVRTAVTVNRFVTRIKELESKNKELESSKNFLDRIYTKRTDFAKKRIKELEDKHAKLAAENKVLAKQSEEHLEIHGTNTLLSLMVT